MHCPLQPLIILLTIIIFLMFTHLLTIQILCLWDVTGAFGPHTVKQSTAAIMNKMATLPALQSLCTQSMRWAYKSAEVVLTDSMWAVWSGWCCNASCHWGMGTGIDWRRRDVVFLPFLDDKHAFLGWSRKENYINFSGSNVFFLLLLLLYNFFLLMNW